MPVGAAKLSRGFVAFGGGSANARVSSRLTLSREIAGTAGEAPDSSGVTADAGGDAELVRFPIAPDNNGRELKGVEYAVVVQLVQQRGAGL